MRLSKSEQEKVSNMRRLGFGYRRIAKFLGLNTMAVKYYLGKTWTGEEEISTSVSIKDLCPNCGLPVVQIPHKRRRIYCSDKCRLQSWHKKNYKSKKREVVVDDRSTEKTDT